MMDFLHSLIRRPDGTPRAAFWAPAMLLVLLIVGLVWQSNTMP
ncbi:MAG TPA: hypothetical protein VHC40_05735 [Rhizomicrobium sp.]|nr:hypothetical protein [Rhizomicrobium sp.]